MRLLIILGIFFQNFVFAELPKTALLLATGTNFDVTSFEIGNSFCALINEKTSKNNVKCITMETAGSLKNIDIVLSNKSNIGIAELNTILSSEKKENLRVIARLYSAPLFILSSKNSDVNSFNDILLQKNINLGNKESGDNNLGKLIFKESDWEKGNLLELGRQDIASLFCKNELDISFLVTKNPSPFIENITNKCGAKIVSLEDIFIQKFIQKNKIFSEFTIPANSYANQPIEIKTVAIDVVLFASKETPDELVQEILNTIFDDIKRLQSSNATFKDVKIRSFFPKSLLSEPILLHKGAEKFLKDMEKNENYSINK
jgi:TRAP transporter TAXI family solute receptor